MNMNSNGVDNDVSYRQRSNKSPSSASFSEVWSCLFFIIENAIHTLPGDYTGDILLRLILFMQANFGKYHALDVIFREFAEILAINLKVKVIDETKEYWLLFNYSIEENNWRRNCLVVFDQRNGTFTSIYMQDGNLNKYTVSLPNTPDIHQRLENLDHVHNPLHTTQEEISAPDEEPEDVSYESVEVTRSNDHPQDEQPHVLYTNAEDIQDNLQDGNKAPPKLNSLWQTTNIVQPILTACSNGSFTMAIAILVNQIIRLWHHRYLSDGVNKPISNIQIEESYSHCGLKILIPKVPDEIIGLLYVGARPVNCKNDVHARNLIVPGGTMFQEYHDANNKIQYSTHNTKANLDIFVEKTKFIYSKITKEENGGIKELKIGMIIDNCVELSRSQKKRKLLKWTKLEIAFYIKEGDGFRRVSNYTYTDLIQQISGSHTDYQKNGLIRTSLCANGGQMICNELPSIFNKNDLFVIVNGQPLEPNKYQLAKNYLSFVSPRGVPGTSLYITAMIMDNPDNVFESNLPYKAHDDHPDPCND